MGLPYGAWRSPGQYRKVGKYGAETEKELWQQLNVDQAEQLTDITGEEVLVPEDVEIQRIKDYDISLSDYEEDLTDLRTVTIDPSNAHDFDDALSITETEDGYTARVHIADVPFYLTQDGRVEEKVFERGRSTYYNGAADHMLPGDLAEELSLMEGQERLTNTIEISFDENLRPTGETDIYRALVEVDHNLAYGEVNQYAKTTTTSAVTEEEEELEQKLQESLGGFGSESPKDPKIKALQEFATPKTDTTYYGVLSKEEQNIVDDIELLKRAARHLADDRLDQLVYERGSGYLIVEEFMLHANKVCAEELAEKPFGVYRVHGSPQTDWVAELDKYVAENLDEPYGRLIEANDPLLAWKRIEEQYDDEALPTLFAPTADKYEWAYYAPVNRGHEALGFEAYAPFTSPVRRAADIVNWRILHEEFQKDHEDIIRLIDQWNHPVPLRDGYFQDEEAETTEVSQFDTEALEEEPLLPER